MNDHGSGGGCMYPVYQKELEWTVDLMLDRAGTHSIGISTEHLTEVYLQPNLFNSYNKNQIMSPVSSLEIFMSLSIYI